MYLSTEMRWSHFYLPESKRSSSHYFQKTSPNQWTETLPAVMAGLHLPDLYSTTPGSTEYMVTGLELDGDEYLVKRFKLAEQEARLTFLTRRIFFLFSMKLKSTSLSFSKMFD